MKKDWLIITLVFLSATALLYGYYYFFTNVRMANIYKNWDGPDYVIIAKSLYRPELAVLHNTINSKDIRPDWTFLPAHFPLYALLIRAVSGLGIGDFQAMLLISVTASLGAILAFYELVRRRRLTSRPLFLALPFIFLSPRWFVVSHVGGSDSLFLLLFILFLGFFLSGRHKPAAAMAALAQLTRPQGILLGVALLALALPQLPSLGLRRFVQSYYPYLLLPLALLSIFIFYYFQTGDFWAFFSAISIFHHTSPVPFSTFTYYSENVETFWQEVNALDYILYFGAVLMLLKSRLRTLGIFGLVFFLPLPFLHHSDISRYALPLLPLALIAYRRLLANREFNLATLAMSPAVIRYAINFTMHNHGL